MFSGIRTQPMARSAPTISGKEIGECLMVHRLLIFTEWDQIRASLAVVTPGSAESTG